VPGARWVDDWVGFCTLEGKCELKVPGIRWIDRKQLDTLSWQSTQIEDRGYNANGLLTSIDRAFEDESRVYDDASQLTSISSTSVGTLTYSYDNNGNVLGEAQGGVMAQYSFTTQKSGAITFADGYDDANRFMRYIRTAVSEDYLLGRSGIGNISSANLNGSSTSRMYNDVHAMTGLGASSQSYDSDGNATTLHTGVTLDWDDAGRVQATHVGSSATAGIVGDNEYGYLDGKKIWRKITRGGSVVTNEVYIYAGPNRIAEYSASQAATNPLRQRVFADGIDSLSAIVQSNGNVLIPTRNRQWSIVALTDNSTGSVLERYSYDQFGERTIYAANGTTTRTTSTYTNNYGYTSREQLPESGLMYFRARHYDQTFGEFLSKDLMEFVDGTSLYRAYFVPGKVDPTGRKLRVPRDREQNYFTGLLNKLCPEGNFKISFWDNVYSDNDGFCNGRWVKRTVPCRTGCCASGFREGRFWVGPTHQNGAHKISCKCICDAINSDRDITVYRRPKPGGSTAGTIGDSPEVYVGPGRPGGYTGTGDTNPPSTGTVRSTDWMIFGHELCGHAVTMHSGQNTPSDSRLAVDVENDIREEHSCPSTCTHPDRNDWGERDGNDHAY